MKKIVNTLALLSLFIMLPLTVAADCDSDFKAVEKDFKVSYKYNADTDDFDIIFVNPDYEKYTFGFHDKDEINHVEMKYDGKQATITRKNYKETNYNYAFLALYSGCTDKVVKNGTLELKKYNPHSDNPLCVGNEDFVLCQKDYDKAVDEETFTSRLEAYKNSKEKEEQENVAPTKKDATSEEKEKLNIFNNMLKYIEEHTVEVIIIIIFIIAAIIGTIVYIKKLIKSRRLE